MSGSEVARPRKKSEYRIVFAERSAEKGWRDLVAATRNAVADAWDLIRRSPAWQPTWTGRSPRSGPAR